MIELEYKSKSFKNFIRKMSLKSQISRTKNFEWFRKVNKIGFGGVMEWMDEINQAHESLAFCSRCIMFKRGVMSDTVSIQVSLESILLEYQQKANSDFLQKTGNEFVTFSGAKIDPLGFSRKDVRIEDIASLNLHCIYTAIRLDLHGVGDLEHYFPLILYQCCADFETFFILSLKRSFI